MEGEEPGFRAGAAGVWAGRLRNRPAWGTSVATPFNKPSAVGAEFDYIRQALDAGHLSGDGVFTKRCHAWLEARLGGRALLTHS